MKRIATVVTLIGSLVFAANLQAQQNEKQLLDLYLVEIEQLISVNDIDGARSKLAEAASANIRDESLEMIHSQLRLLESLNDSSGGSTEIATGTNTQGSLTDEDQLAAVDLLDSLRIAMENGELEKVQRFSDARPETNSLLTAVFQNYTAMKIEVSAPEADVDTQSFLATLEFKEFTTKDGSTAFPAQAWKSHRLRIIKSDGVWQKILW